ncbi:hypothetical protein CFC21_090494 [Triticum aestivum]|uniref:PGG domain-containing protein n=2 Tax=Triticum aestivum TaxID=4565 RepID=A0A3B6UAR1_WHEAT|nr:hypothetical protein CFC21_090494 [Triticum aestivum]
MKMLLEWNNNLTLQGDKNGSTPLLFAVIRTLRQICSQLLIASPDALYQHDHNGSFPTHVASSVGATRVIADFLMKSPNCADLRDARGRTFLYVAVDEMEIKTVNYICRNIALSWILNMQDKDENTALHLAIRKGSLLMFCSLLGNRQVQLNLKNEKGETPLDTTHHAIPKGIYVKGEHEVRILKALKYVSAKRGIVRQGFLDEYDIDQARQEEIHIMSQVKEGTQNLCIGSVLIATVTFGATFTMPGGLRADDETNAGLPTLAGTFHFYAFIVANTLAFTLSVMATISFIFSGDPTVHLRTRKVLFIRAIPLLLISVSSMVVAFALGTYMMLAPIAPVSALAIFFILILILVYYSWEMTISGIVLLTALCKRKGKWYGIVWAWQRAFLLVVIILSSLLLLAFKLAQMSHTGGKVEPPAQPPTSFA